MARIPDEELERLKREVSLARLIEGQGLTLITQGKDFGLYPVFRTAVSDAGVAAKSDAGSSETAGTVDALLC